MKEIEIEIQCECSWWEWLLDKGQKLHFINSSNITFPWLHCPWLHYPWLYIHPFILFCVVLSQNIIENMMNIMGYVFQFCHSFMHFIWDTVHHILKSKWLAPISLEWYVHHFLTFLFIKSRLKANEDYLKVINDCKGLQWWACILRAIDSFCIKREKFWKWYTKAFFETCSLHVWHSNKYSYAKVLQICRRIFMPVDKTKSSQKISMLLEGFYSVSE